MEGNQLLIYIISDSSGFSARSIVNGAMSQFPDIDFSSHVFTFIQERDILLNIVEKAQQNDALICYTLAEPQMREDLIDYCESLGVHQLDLLNPLLKEITDITGQEPSQENQSIADLDHTYFSRIEAMEFAVQHDDGKDPSGFKKADIVLIGISRTSKTPLSIYLANFNYKVANLPLLPETEIPKEIFEVDPNRIIGLTNSPRQLKNIREERLRSYGITGETGYDSDDRIKKEIKHANKLFNKLDCLVIDVSNKSIEEAATIILNYLDHD